MKSGRHLISSATMVVSLLLLLCFLLYWNISNYKTVKEELKKDLQVQLRLAEAQFADSIMVSVFEVVVQESPRSNTFEVVTDDSLDLKGANSITKYDFSWGNKIPKLKKTFPEIDSLREFVFKIDTSSHEVFYREVTLDSGHNHHYDASDMILFPQGDTATINEQSVTIQYFDDTKAKVLTKRKAEIVYNNFTKNLDKSGLPAIFSSVMTYNKNDEGGDGIIVKLEKSKNEVFIFNSYNPFLLRQIYPSLIASILLFGLIALSFYLMRKNIIEQMRLASAKNQFVANMTHELKTPISTVGVALEALKKYGAIDDPIKTNEYIDISQRELSRLQILVDKVLKMSALDEEIEVLHLEKVDMNKVIQDVMNSMRLHLEQKGIVSNLNSSGNQWIVDGDPVHLTNVIYNLIDNGVKYGGENPVLSINLQENGPAISISVKDNGIGIAKEHQSKIFDRFYRVPTNDTHDVKGHGLGLNYIASVIRQLGGTISLDSRLSQGSEFTIQLPKSTS